MTGIVVPSRLLPNQGRYPGVKPVGNVEIDYTHPLARDIKRVYLHQEGTSEPDSFVLDLVNKHNSKSVRVTSPTPNDVNDYFTKTIHPTLGPCIRSGTDTNWANEHALRIDPIGQMYQGTIISFFVHELSFQPWRHVFSHVDYIANRRIYLGISASSELSDAASDSIWVRLNGAVGVHQSAPLSDGGLYTQKSIGLSWGGVATNSRIYLNGKYIASYDRGTTSYTGSDMDITNLGWVNPTGSSSMVGYHGPLFIWDRQLSDIEVSEFYLDPYQFLRSV